MSNSLIEKYRVKCKALGMEPLNISIVDNKNTVVEGEYKSNKVIIPRFIESIGERAFYNNSYIESIELGDNVKSIGERAFSFCSLLENINLNNVEKIGSRAFDGCDKLRNIELENVRIIEGEAFIGCKELSRVRFGDNIEEIPRNVLAYNGALKEVSIGNKARVIQMNAFNECSRLKSIDIGTVSMIKIGTFMMCRELRDIDLSKVTYIGEKAFYSSGIEKADLSNLEYLGVRAFDQCTSLCGEIRLGKNIKRIRDGAFFNTGINSLTIEGNLQELGKNVFRHCVSLEKVKIVGGVKVIRENSFALCSKLVDLELGEGVEIIESKAFFNTGVKVVRMPKSIKRIDRLAFENSGVKEVHIPKGAQLDKDAFKGCSDDLKIIRY